MSTISTNQPGVQAAQTPSEVPAAADSASADAQQLYNDLSALENDINAQLAQYRDEAQERNYSDFSPVGSDPVRLATGEFTSTETDLSFPMPGGMMRITRTYLAAGFGSGSFGSLWSFPFDTRVIRGIKPYAQDDVTNANRVYATLNTRYNKLNADYTAALKAIDDAKAAVQGAIDTINQSIQAMQAAFAAAPSQIQSIISSDIAAAQALIGSDDKPSTLKGKLVTLNSNRTALTDCRSKIDGIAALRDAALAKLQQAILERDVTDSIDQGNKYVVDAKTPPHLRPYGLNTLVVVDEQGTPHAYTIITQPTLTSTTRLSDGRPNYYPWGSYTTADIPSETDIVKILSDGSYSVAKKDRRVFMYDIYGRLASITDPNDNTLRMEYGTDGKAGAIVDTAGRRTTLSRSSGHITTIVDPLGRSIGYGYDADGKLVSVTDPSGVTIGYQYTGSLLTAILKPDGSSRTYGYDAAGRTVAVTDEEGNSEHISYYSGYTERADAQGIVDRHFFDYRNHETRVEYADGSFETMTYTNDDLTQKVDAAGGTWNYTYDAKHNLLTVGSPEGTTESWIYTAQDLVATHTDANGSTTTYGYDAAGNLVTVTDAENGVTSYAYDSLGLCVSATNANNRTTMFEYDVYGNPSATVDPLSYRTRYECDAVGRMTSVTDPAGNRTAYEYSADDKVTLITYPSGTTESYTYNDRKDLVARTDTAGNLIQYEYDKRHLLTKVTNPLGETAVYDYRPDGRVISRNIDGKSHTTYVYDLRGNLASRTQVETQSVTSYTYDGLSRILTMTDPRNNVTRYTYDLLGRLTHVKDPAGFMQVFGYDDIGNVTSITDKLGSTYALAYDSMNRLIRRTDPYGHARTTTYDPLGNPISMTDENGATTRYGYDANNRLSYRTDALGHTVTYTYTSTGKVHTNTDQAGNVTVYTYDAEGRVTSVTDPLGGVQSFGYDALGDLSLITDANGNSTVQEFDALGRVVKRSDALGNSTRFQYHYLGKPASVTDPLGNVQNLHYDAAGRLASAIDPMGNKRTYSYDAAGNLLQSKDELNRKTTYAYDSLGAVTRVTDPLNEVISYQRDALGNVVSITYANGSTYGYDYDALARPIKETNQLGQSQSRAYDGVGNQVRLTDFAGHTTTTAYDALGRVTDVTYFNGTKKSFAYDAVGNLIHAQNSAGELEYSYDPDGRLTRSVDAASGQALEYAYDAGGNRTRLFWQERNQIVSYAYDKLNRLSVLTDPDGKATTITYDPVGREAARTLANGVVTRRTYDANGRLIALKNTADGGGYGGEPLLSEAYLYNAAGQRTFTVDSEGKITKYGYDDAGRLTQVSYPLSNAKMLEDLKERVALGLISPDVPEGGTAGGRTQSTQSQHRDSTPRWGSDVDGVFGQLPSKQFRNFDLEKLRGQMTHLGWSAYRGWHFGIGRRARAFGDRLTVDRQTSGELTDAYELISEERDLNLRQWIWEEEFSYDKAGNRLTETNGWGEVSYSYNEANQMLAAGSRAFTYDANGNLVKESLRELEALYQYSPENRMVLAATNIVDSFSGGLGHGFHDLFPDGHEEELWSGTRKVSYTYDVLGRRNTRVGWLDLREDARTPTQATTEADSEETLKMVYDPAERATVIVGGEMDCTTSKGWEDRLTQQFVYDGLSMSVVAELNNARGVHHDDRHGGKAGRTTVQYVEANGTVIERREVTSWYDRENTDYYTQDIVGSTLQTTDAWGEVKRTYRYDAFGNLTNGDLSGTNQLGFNGKRYDPTLSLYNYGFRDYSPRMARWTTVDPIKAGPLGNWYVLCNNDPINFFDPDGLDPHQNGGQPISGTPSTIDIEAFTTNLELNLGQDYTHGSNDCDAWLYNRETESGSTMPEGFNSPDDPVREHIDNMLEAGTIDPLTADTSLSGGAYGVMMENSQYPSETAHTLALVIDTDSSVDMYEQGGHHLQSSSTSYDSVADFLADPIYSTDPSVNPFYSSGYHGFDTFYYYPITGGAGSASKED